MSERVGSVLVLGAAGAVAVAALVLSVAGVEADPGNAPVAEPREAHVVRPPMPSPFLPAPPAPETLVPATAAGARVLGVLDRVRQSMRATRYQHDTRIRERDGLYYWDCSAMAAWVLGRAAPRAMSAVNGTRPVARDFFRAIDRAPVRGGRRGWMRIPVLADARPGDVFAWLRPADWPPRNTGHVGFVLAPPQRVPGLDGAYTVRILDATSVPHQNDTRDYEGEGGFGEGTIMFMTGPDGGGTHYGWHGTRAGFTAATRIVIGRVLR